MTEYEEWVVDRFGGPKPVDGIKNYIDEFRRNIGQTALPIQLMEVAKNMGLNSSPIYTSLDFHGQLFA